jgi:hypothetical protein
VIYVWHPACAPRLTYLGLMLAALTEFFVTNLII